MALYVCKSEVKIEDFLLKKVSDIMIQKSIENDDTCVVVCSLDLTKNGKRIYKEYNDSNILKIGQKIDVVLGWDKLSKINKHFKGYINEIKVNNDSRTLEISCQDNAYLLRKTKFNFSTKSITLKELGEKIAGELLSKFDVKIEVENDLEFSIKNFVAEQTTGYDILKHIRDEYNIISTFRDNKLVIGINFLEEKEGSKQFGFTQIPKELQKQHGYNYLYVLDSNSLKYRKLEDVKYKVVANVINKKNEKTEYKLGDEDGNQKEFFFYGDYSSKEVEKLVENELKRVKYSGFAEGSIFRCFGRMNIDYEQRDLEILDSILLDGVGFTRDLTGIQNVLPLSKYLVKGVKYMFNSNGFFADVELGQNIDFDVKTGLWDSIKTKK